MSRVFGYATRGNGMVTSMTDQIETRIRDSYRILLAVSELEFNALKFAYFRAGYLSALEDQRIIQVTHEKTQTDPKN
jgi:hypothetical protein